MSAFAGGFLPYLFLSGATAILGMAALTLLPESAVPLAIVLGLPALLGGPVVVLLVALKRGGRGRFLGALLGLPFLLLPQQAIVWWQMGSVYLLNKREFSSSLQEHQVLVMQDMYASVDDESCSAICLQILWSTPYTVVIEEWPSRRWFAFRLGHGAECQQPTLVKAYLELLSHQYVNTCAVRSEVAPPTDGLIVRGSGNPESELRAQLPFHGAALELHERIDGHDRLLGRWASIVVPAGTLFFDPLGVQDSNAIATFKSSEFFSQVVGARIEDELALGSAEIPDVLDALRPYFANPDTLPWAMYAFEEIARDGQSGEQMLLRAFVQERLDELRASPNANQDWVRWLEGWVARQ